MVSSDFIFNKIKGIGALYRDTWTFCLTLKSSPAHRSSPPPLPLSPLALFVSSLAMHVCHLLAWASYHQRGYYFHDGHGSLGNMKSSIQCGAIVSHHPLKPGWLTKFFLTPGRILREVLRHALHMLRWRLCSQ